MTHRTFQDMLERLECVTLKHFPLLKPDSRRLAKKVHARTITQVEAIRFIKRLQKLNIF